MARSKYQCCQIPVIALSPVAAETAALLGDCDGSGSVLGERGCVFVASDAVCIIRHRNHDRHLQWLPPGKDRPDLAGCTEGVSSTQRYEVWPNMRATFRPACRTAVVWWAATPSTALCSSLLAVPCSVHQQKMAMTNSVLLGFTRTDRQGALRQSWSVHEGPY